MNPIKNYIIDMDGVLIKGTGLIPGANEFIERLQHSDKGYLVLTNNSLYTPKNLAHRLQVLGLNISA
ncbi:MAG: TIGR01457 family HAD-type hydrolase, partial [Anaerolineales bacterium]